MKIRLLLLAMLLLGTTTIFAAPFQNVKKILRQPDGTELHCYASGDEFYSRLHDADGYTIVQASNGYFVYATSDARGNVVATEHVAGVADPKVLGLKPNVMISQEEYQKRRDAMRVDSRDAKEDAVLNHGVYNNLVVFIKFKGDADLTTTKTEIDSMFNYDGYYDISMNNYFKKATYNQLSMVSHCYPLPEGDKVIAYEDIYPRNYYQPYNPTTNPEGYTNQAEREFPLLKRAIEFVAEQVPDTLNLDRNEDGYIDNVIFVVKGNVGDWSDLLWPHMWTMYGEEAYINGKRVGTFNFQLETSSYFSVSTLCHEMSHSLGFPDLYHYVPGTDHLSPSGPWDLMCGNAQPPQHSSTYMKYEYGTWIDEIPEITEYGTYTIEANSWEGGRRNCYKIASNNPKQFYLLEFRNKNNFFEKGLPNSGLLIYRIDTRFDGCADYNGYDTFDEVYIFRPGGSSTQNGTINGAAFSENLNRTEFNINTDPYPFLNKNTEDLEFNICNISEIGDQMTFTYCPIDTETTPENLQVNVNSSDKHVELKWDVNELAESYIIYRDGDSIANVTENYFNDAYSDDMHGYHKYHVTSISAGEESYPSNEKIVILGNYSEFVVNMYTNGENGWQGAEIVASFDNGMENEYYTIYSGQEREMRILVPQGTKINLSWISGWNDTECSFTITKNDETIYTSSDLQEGLLTELIASGENVTSITPENLEANVECNNVVLTWNSIVESQSYVVLRDGEVIADNVMTNSYTDKEVPLSGTYQYCVKSKNDNCESNPSNVDMVTVMKLNYNELSVESNIIDNNVELTWNQIVSNDNILRYCDDEYLTNEGSASNNWGIVITAELLKLFKYDDVASIEIFDACEADYTFKIYNGTTPHDSILLYTETFTTTNSNSFVKFDLAEKVPFDNTKDLWIVAKASKTKPIPCGNYCGNPNSSMIKAGISWKPATEYNLPYSWLLRAYTSSSDNLSDALTYNVYRDNTMIASELTAPNYVDNDVEGKVCYKVEALCDGAIVATSEEVCVETQSDAGDAIYPGLTNDYINIRAKDIINVKIVSVTGAVVYNVDTDVQEFKIDIRNLRSGTYVVQVTTNTEIYTEKVVVAF